MQNVHTYTGAAFTCSVRCMLFAACTGASSMAPALALLTAGLSGAQLRAEVSTPDAPRHHALRRMAPRFCCRQWEHNSATVVATFTQHSRCKAAQYVLLQQHCSSVCSRQLN